MKESSTTSLFDPINIKIVKNPDIGDNMAKITLIGIGGGGCNMIDNYCEKNEHKIKIIAMNTDNQALDASHSPIKLQLGPKTTNGLGAGMNPEVGEKAALESIDEIKKVMIGSDMIFLCAGLGGGTGSGSIPVIAKFAKELGILSFAVVTMPFEYELGRDVIATSAIEKLKNEVDSYMIIYNDKILSIVPEPTGVEESFKIIDNVLFDAVNGLCEIILNYQRLNINVDFADISATLTSKGLSLIGIGQEKGADSGKKAFLNAINAPLMKIDSIKNAKTLIIHFTFNPKFSIHKMTEIMNYVKTNADIAAKCIIGTVYKDDMEEDEVKVTLIATGFNKDIKVKNEDIEEFKIKKEETISFKKRLKRFLLDLF